MMTKKNFQAVADVILRIRPRVDDLNGPNGPTTLELVVQELVRIFEADNPNFDRDRFIEATYPKASE